MDGLTKRKKTKAYLKLRKFKYKEAFEIFDSILKHEIRIESQNIGLTLQEMYRTAYKQHKNKSDSTLLEKWRKLMHVLTEILIKSLEKSKGKLTLRMWDEILIYLDEQIIKETEILSLRNTSSLRLDDSVLNTTLSQDEFDDLSICASITLNEHFYETVDISPLNEMYVRTLYGKAQCLANLGDTEYSWDVFLKIYNIHNKTIDTLLLIGTLIDDNHLNNWCKLIETHNNPSIITDIENRVKNLHEEKISIEKSVNESTLAVDLKEEEIKSNVASIEGSITEKEREIDNNKELINSNEIALEIETSNLKVRESERDYECKKLQNLETQIDMSTNQYTINDLEQEKSRVKSRIRELDKICNEISRKIDEKNYFIDKVKHKIDSFENEIDKYKDKLKSLSDKNYNKSELDKDKIKNINDKQNILLQTWEKFFPCDKFQNNDVLLNKAKFLWEIEKYELSWKYYKQFYNNSIINKSKNIIILFEFACKMEKLNFNYGLIEWKELMMELIKNNECGVNSLNEIRLEIRKKGKMSLYKDLDDCMHSWKIMHASTSEDWSSVRPQYRHTDSMTTFSTQDSQNTSVLHEQFKQ